MSWEDEKEYIVADIRDLKSDVREVKEAVFEIKTKLTDTPKVSKLEKLTKKPLVQTLLIGLLCSSLSIGAFKCYTPNYSCEAQEVHKKEVKK